MKARPPELRDKFNEIAEQLCISSITLGELHYGAERPARRAENLTALAHFAARLDVLPFGDKAAAHYGQLRTELEQAGTPCGPYDMQIGGHARSEGLILVTNNVREFCGRRAYPAARGKRCWEHSCANVVTLTARTVSSRHLLPGTSSQQASERSVGWIPGTRPG